MSSTIALVELEPIDLNATRDVPIEPPSGDRLSIHSLHPVASRSEPYTRPEILAEPAPKLRGGKALVVSLQLALVTCCSSFATGMITLGIVDIAADLQLDPSLVYWPVLAFNLASSPLLIPFGAVADVVGARSICLLGSLVCGTCILLCGLAKNGNDLIAFRCLHGVGGAMFLPTSMSILSTTLTSGKIRNMALGALGLSMVVGYAAGLVLGGVLLSTIGWRVGFYASGGLQIALFGLGLWTVPSIPTVDRGEPRLSPWQRLRAHVDWVGALSLCVCIGMLSYVLAMIAEDIASIRQPLNASLLAVSLLLVPAFIAWMRYQERRHRPALIPGSLWKPTFTTICIVVAFANAEMQGMELLASLLSVPIPLFSARSPADAHASFQNVQLLTPLRTSLYLLPGLVAGATVNVITGSVVHRVRVSWTLAGAAVLGGVAPLLMAVINPRLPYWYEAFPAQVLYPFCIDFVYVISAIVISDSFPARDQALAGAVFNTIANLGQALGLALVAILVNAVTQAHLDETAGRGGVAEQVQALLVGYRAGFWAAFASMMLTAGIGALGLRRAGAVGIKRD